MLKTSPRDTGSWDGTPIYGWYPPTLYLYTLQDGQAVRAGEVDLYFGTAGREAAVAARMTEDGVQCVFLNGENVNDLIRTGEVSAAASRTSTVKEVRSRMTALQKDLAAKTSVVMDGRDIGTAVLPHAYLKVYMTASASVRAKRRYDENIAKGIDCSLEEIEKDIIERDERDMTRKESPLKKAWDAIELDTSYMTAAEAAEKIISWM